MNSKDLLRAGILAAGIAASDNTNASDNLAREASSEQVGNVFRVNDDINVFTTEENLEDWYHQKKLIHFGEKVLYQPVENYPGFCEFALDGYIQVYDVNFKDRFRSANGKIDLGEQILNLAELNPEKKFLFPCDLKSEITPNIVVVPGPGETVEKKVSTGTFSPGLGYVHTFIDPEENGNIAYLPGAELSFTYQPRKSNWYFGPYVAMYGNADSTSIPVSSAAAEGPLAGQLVLRGENNYDTTIFGGALGFIVGRDLYHNKNDFGVGLEVYAALMPQWTTTEFTEKSAYFINDAIVEGSAISNANDDKEFNFFVSNGVGLRVEGPHFFVTPSMRFRTNFDSLDDAIIGLSAGYNPKQE